MASLSALPDTVLPVPDWPDIDRELWLASQVPRDQFDGPAPASGLEPITIRALAVGYGRWLAVLSASGTLDPAVPPAARVTPAQARAYLSALRSAGNANSTITTRFFELRSALRIMQPEADLRWLISPGGTSLRTLLPTERRQVDPLDSAVLYAWGRELMRDALCREHPMVRAARYRDGLLIAILAALAPRARTTVATQLGRHIFRHGDSFWLAFTTKDVKNQRVIEYPLPPKLTPCVDRYLKVERAELLGSGRHDWLWVRRDGERMNEGDLCSLIRYASKARFGTAFGPHRFRHALATTAARFDPSNPGLAAAVLAISDAVVNEHYNLARQEHAAQEYTKLLDDERRRTRLLAERLFRHLDD